MTFRDLGFAAREVRLSGRRVIAQKQNGLYAVSYHPMGGVPETEKFAELYAAIESMEDEQIYVTKAVITRHVEEHFCLQ